MNGGAELRGSQASSRRIEANVDGCDLNMIAPTYEGYELYSAAL
jgi:hypothetical protein